jgi:hypothetical protein
LASAVMATARSARTRMMTFMIDILLYRNDDMINLYLKGHQNLIQNNTNNKFTHDVNWLIATTTFNSS